MVSHGRCSCRAPFPATRRCLPERYAPECGACQRCHGGSQTTRPDGVVGPGRGAPLQTLWPTAWPDAHEIRCNSAPVQYLADEQDEIGRHRAAVARPSLLNGRSGTCDLDEWPSRARQQLSGREPSDSAAWPRRVQIGVCRSQTTAVKGICFLNMTGDRPLIESGRPTERTASRSWTTTRTLKHGQVA